MDKVGYKLGIVGSIVIIFGILGSATANIADDNSDMIADLQEEIAANKRHIVSVNSRITSHIEGTRDSAVRAVREYQNFAERCAFDNPLNVTSVATRERIVVRSGYQIDPYETVELVYRCDVGKLKE